MTGRPLDRIQVRGYKSIRELDLELRPLNVLIGPNGAGKSNLLQVFELLREIEWRNLQVHVGRAGGADALLHFGRKKTKQIEVEFDAGGDTYWCHLVLASENRLIFAEEGYETDGQDMPRGAHREVMGRGHLETAIPGISIYRPGVEVFSRLVGTMRYWLLHRFADTGETSPIRATCDLNDNRVLRENGSNLAAYLYYLAQRHPTHYQSIVDTVRLAAPFFDDFALKPSRLNPEKIMLEWRERGSDAYFGPSALSDGTLRFMCLATLLQMPDPPSTILIDEPELGLHPYAIALLAAMLRSAAERTQVIVSTQSVTLVNHLELDDIIVVDREDGASVFRRPDAAQLGEWMQEYGAGDLWEKNLLGGRP